MRTATTELPLSHTETHRPDGVPAEWMPSATSSGIGCCALELTIGEIETGQYQLPVSGNRKCPVPPGKPAPNCTNPTKCNLKGGCTDPPIYPA